MKKEIAKDKETIKEIVGAIAIFGMVFFSWILLAAF